MFHPVQPTVYQQSTLGKVTRAYSGVHRRRRDNGFSAYPRMSEVVRRAEACGVDDHADSFDDLFLGDLIHANAITSLKLLEDDRISGANPNLTGLMKRGLLDRETEEGDSTPAEVNSMRFAAACAAHLVDHTSDLTERVSDGSSCVRRHG